MPKPALPCPTSAQITDLLTSLNLPTPMRIERLAASTGVYHSIFTIHLTCDTTMAFQNLKTRTISELILRVAGRQYPCRKTTNEIATILWVSAHTSIPVPGIVAWDNSCDNPLGCEFTLMEKVQGETLSNIIDDLDVEDRKELVSQVEMIEQLHSHDLNFVGGLNVDKSCYPLIGYIDKNEEKVKPGPIILFDF